MSEARPRTILVSDEDWEALREAVKAEGYSTRGAWFKAVIAQKVGGGVDGSTPKATETELTGSADAGARREEEHDIHISELKEEVEPMVEEAERVDLEEMIAAGLVQVGVEGIEAEVEEPERRMVYEEITRWRLNPLREPIQTDGEYELPLWKDERGKYMDNAGKDLPHAVVRMLEGLVAKGRMRWETE